MLNTKNAKNAKNAKMRNFQHIVFAQERNILGKKRERGSEARDGEEKGWIGGRKQKRYCGVLP
jgi:hypothetical protein